MSYILCLIILLPSLLLFVQYRRIIATIQRIKVGCFILLPFHHVPKFISLNERSFDLENIPTHFFLLLLLHEDDKFLRHRGFNKSEMFRAFVEFIFKGRMRGGSSITQQTAKSLFTKGERSFKRKLVETIGAVALEQCLTKEEILYLYLHTLRSVSIVSSLPDILSYLLDIENISKISVAQSEFIVSLIPAPTTRINKIKKLGMAAYDFCYSHEKILVLTKIFNKKRIEEGHLGFVSHLEIIKTELMEYSLPFPVNLNSSVNEEINCIVRATIILSKIQESLNKIILGNLPKIGPKFFLTKWQMALLQLTHDCQCDDTYLGGLSVQDESRIIFVAKKNKMLQLLSEQKARLYELKLIVHAIELERDKNDLSFNLEDDTKQLVAELTKDEVTNATFLSPNFGKSVERFFTLN